MMMARPRHSPRRVRVATWLFEPTTVPRAAVWAVLLALVLNLLTGYLVLKERSDRRKNVNEAVCQALGPNDVTRKAFGCPAPKPSIPHTTTTKTTSRPGPRVTTTTTIVASQPRAVQPFQTRPSAAPSSSQAQAGRSPVRIASPTTGGTKTTTRTSTAPPAASAPATTPPVVNVPSLTCGVLGVFCRRD